MILVTGGTGLLGAHLLYKLVVQGKEVKAIHRDSSSFENVKNIFSFYSTSSEELFLKVIWVKADINDVPALELAFKNVTKVYHCAADLSFDISNYNASRKVNVEGTANIVNLCLSNEVTKLCHVSSIATIGEEVIKPITEETKWSPESNSNNIYAITKYDAELEVWRGVQEGLSVVVVNPGVILGPGFWNSGTGEIFAKVADGFRYYTSGTVGMIGVNDVVKSMILLMNSGIKNDQFILVSENITYQELMQNIIQVTGSKNTSKEIKKWQLLFVLKINALLGFFNIRKRSLYKANVNSVFKNLVYDNSKIKKAVEIEFTPIVDVIKNIGFFFTKQY
jgi:nucleoside-diphosphate-sugar epimerase